MASMRDAICRPQWVGKLRAYARILSVSFPGRPVSIYRVGTRAFARVIRVTDCDELVLDGQVLTRLCTYLDGRLMQEDIAC